MNINSGELTFHNPVVLVLTCGISTNSTHQRVMKPTGNNFEKHGPVSLPGREEYRFRLQPRNYFPTVDDGGMIDAGRTLGSPFSNC